MARTSRTLYIKTRSGLVLAGDASRFDCQDPTNDAAGVPSPDLFDDHNSVPSFLGSNRSSQSTVSLGSSRCFFEGQITSKALMLGKVISEQTIVAPRIVVQ